MNFVLILCVMLYGIVNVDAVKSEHNVTRQNDIINGFHFFQHKLSNGTSILEKLFYHKPSKLGLGRNFLEFSKEDYEEDNNLGSKAEFSDFSFDLNPCISEDCGSPLNLSLFIELENLDEAINIAEVQSNLILPPILSYSGFFTVDYITNSHLFFWLFPTVDRHDAPFIVHLQGGPGQSAIFDIFNGLGPFVLDRHLNAGINKHALYNTANVLYFDNPVGTGFSFSSKGTVESLEQATEHLYSGLIQFFTVFYHFKTCPLYIYGEGYGARVALSLANHIHKEKQLELKGVILGSPYLDPDIVFKSANYLMEMGYFNNMEYDELNHKLHEAKNIVKSNCSEALLKIEDAFKQPSKPLDKFGSVGIGKPNITECALKYSFIEVDENHLYNNYHMFFINQPKIRQAIHVGNMVYRNGYQAYTALKNDFMKSYRNDLLLFLNDYKVLMYHGNLDKNVPASIVSTILENINWKHWKEFKLNDKVIWKFTTDGYKSVPVTYIRKTKNFVQATILNSGHFISTEQPKLLYSIISRFVSGQKF